MTKVQGSAISVLLGYIAIIVLSQNPPSEGVEGARLFNLGIITLCTVMGLWGGKDE